MSAPAFAWALDMGREMKLSAPERLVLVVLADRANGKRFCWPSVVQLMLDTGLARHTILKVVHALAGLGLIRIEKKGKHHVYHVERAPEPVQNETDDRSRSAPETGLDLHRTAAQTGANPSPDRCKSDTRTGANLTPKPLREPIKEPEDARERAQARQNAKSPEEGSGSPPPPAPPPKAPVLGATTGGGSTYRQPGAEPDQPVDPKQFAALIGSLTRGFQNNYPPRAAILDRDQQREVIQAAQRPKAKYLPPEYLAVIRRAAGYGVRVS
jgi:hypothetical protein